jgi:hypothetical protein
MAAVKRWTVDVFIDEDEGRTYADARLHTGADTHLVGVGRARLNPADRNIPEIGDELAAARALSDLSQVLLVTATTDIEAVTATPAVSRAARIGPTAAEQRPNVIPLGYKERRSLRLGCVTGA